MEFSLVSLGGYLSADVRSDVIGQGVVKPPVLEKQIPDGPCHLQRTFNVPGSRLGNVLDSIGLVRVLLEHADALLGAAGVVFVRQLLRL